MSRNYLTEEYDGSPSIICLILVIPLVVLTMLIVGADQLWADTFKKETL